MIYVLCDSFCRMSQNGDSRVRIGHAYVQVFLNVQALHKPGILSLWTRKICTVQLKFHEAEENADSMHDLIMHPSLVY